MFIQNKALLYFVVKFQTTIKYLIEYPLEKNWINDWYANGTLMTHDGLLIFSLVHPYHIIFNGKYISLLV